MHVLTKVSFQVTTKQFSKRYKIAGVAPSLKNYLNNRKKFFIIKCDSDHNYKMYTQKNDHCPK